MENITGNLTTEEVLEMERVIGMSFERITVLGQIVENRFNELTKDDAPEFLVGEVLAELITNAKDLKEAGHIGYVFGYMFAEYTIDQEKRSLLNSLFKL